MNNNIENKTVENQKPMKIENEKSSIEIIYNLTKKRGRPAGKPVSKPAGKRGRPAGKPTSKPTGKRGRPAGKPTVKRGKRAVNKKNSWNKWMEFAATHNVIQVKNIICNCSYRMQLKILYAFGIAQLINTKRQIDVLSNDNKQRIKDLMEDYKTVF